MTRPRVGDRIKTLHDCFGASNAVRHSVAFSVLWVHKLNNGGYRAEGLRCDGTPIHVLFNAQGAEVTP